MTILKTIQCDLCLKTCDIGGITMTFKSTDGDWNYQPKMSSSGLDYEELGDYQYIKKHFCSSCLENIRLLKRNER